MSLVGYMIEDLVTLALYNHNNSFASHFDIKKICKIILKIILANLVIFKISWYSYIDKKTY